MRLGFLLPGLALLGLLGTGCNRDQFNKLAADGKEDLTRPGKSAPHIVELDRIKIDEKDFSTNQQGDPLPLQIFLMEDGNEIPAQGGSVLSGTRGEREIYPPLRWSLIFHTEAAYQIVVEEASELTGTARYVVPAQGRIGYWPIPANKGTHRIGKKSEVHFTDQIEE